MSCGWGCVFISPFSCFIVDVSWHVNTSDKTSLVVVLILAHGWSDGLCLNLTTFALTTETYWQCLWLLNYCFSLLDDSSWDLLDVWHAAHDVTGFAWTSVTFLYFTYHLSLCTIYVLLWVHDHISLFTRGHILFDVLVAIHLSGEESWTCDDIIKRLCKNQREDYVFISLNMKQLIERVEHNIT